MMVVMAGSMSVRSLYPLPFSLFLFLAGSPLFFLSQRLSVGVKPLPFLFFHSSASFLTSLLAHSFMLLLSQVLSLPKRPLLSLSFLLLSLFSLSLSHTLSLIHSLSLSHSPSLTHSPSLFFLSFLSLSLFSFLSFLCFNTCICGPMSLSAVVLFLLQEIDL